MTASFALRVETDLLGPRQLPAEALYGIHTLRAAENFPVSRALIGHYPELVRGLAMVKLAAARANRDLGVLGVAHHDAIAAACAQLLEGQHHDAFVVGMIQGGAGTSTNMNANEVIANLGLIALGRRPGDYAHLHPNDHVNRSQSTNDVYPTALRIALLLAARPLEDELARLAQAFRDRAGDFAQVLKLGRTQLQDAVPMTLGAEFAGFAAGVEQDLRHLRTALAELTAVNLGGTAIGTGITAPEGYGPCARAHLAAISGYEIRAAEDLIEASSDMGALVAVSAALRRVVLRLSKICNDLRLLSSGPRAGLGEIHLLPVQAGSSIMPGKINPVIPEMVSQIAYQVIGHDLSVTMAAEAGQLQLNAMEPLIAHALLESLRLLASGVPVLRLRCVEGIRADAERCRAHLEASTAMCTPLVPVIGYSRASGLAQRALAENRPLADLVVAEGLMSAAEFAALERAACAV
ncbi:aspartate ammonia-lyase [Rhodobacter sp. SGA-6-6]|uniref:aspartate ammonia-lyase n=1 Tax=Rhodobacter sp. SGA-6-6 TaxID=2710882 RepID=UPI0013ECD16C|nr:aspartate ammonia-lyase [Rhodobacter sp. SGA-6-6]NGM47079.1 aspartate ammonia-lyase [Rhodobacter sp. SGA-6-6]